METYSAITLPDGHIIETTTEGYLTNPDDWSPVAAETLAERDHLTLTADHWYTIQWLHQYYLDYQMFPSMRTVVLAMRSQWGQEKGNSVYLQSLFPKGFFRQASRIAGLPKPKRCL